jgi:benzoylformate decarboxylase
VLNNSEYAILKWFASIEQVERAPGLDLPALDCVAIGNAYGVAARRVDGRDALGEALRGAIASDSPELIEVPVAPGMWLE